MFPMFFMALVSNLAVQLERQAFICSTLGYIWNNTVPVCHLFLVAVWNHWHGIHCTSYRTAIRKSICKLMEEEKMAMNLRTKHLILIYVVTIDLSVAGAFFSLFIEKLAWQLFRFGVNILLV
uniref:G-protein coupled receptors family 1 profile domain-containing protein n=1 Tax=Arion vulgaris TaxID=1028688 RepID=A0A0B7B703_9EUPU